MSLIYQIPTQGHDIILQAKVTITKPMILIIAGYDTHNPNSVYFRREIGTKSNPLSGVHTIQTPMPITPNSLIFTAYDAMTNSSDGIEVTELKALPLDKKIVVFNSPSDQDFFRFAEIFCKECGYLSPGIYGAKTGKFEIKLSSHIYKADGKISSTPARIFRPEGNIEVSKPYFDKMTVPMRMLILLHEYAHFRANTRNEETADSYAISIYLGMGYPKSEAVYAFTTLFHPVNTMHEQALLARTDKLVSFIRNFQ